MMLVELIESHPVLFSKATNASNNQLKEATWTKLTSSFNSMIASNPRKPEQLRLKWENLKKAARKRSTKIRMNNLKTGGGKPDFIPPDEALDKVASILGSTCDGYSVPFGGDAEIEVVDSTAEKSVEEQNIVIVPFDDGVDPLPPVPAQPALSPLHTSPPPKKFFFSAANSKGKLKHQAAATEAKASVIARNRAIADYYEAKKKREEKMVTLKARKLELEILELEKRICPDPWDNNRDRDKSNN
ncbi:hypothetical protein ACJJTC_016036 [Scirpophaga incertulas]